MQSVKVPDLPIPTCGASAVMINDHIYVCGGGCGSVDLAHQVQVYDVNHNVWSTLPHSPQYSSQGVAINSKLVLIGGREAASDGATNLVSTWTGQGWQQKLPLMPTKRLRPGVTTYHTFVVVAGGRAEDEQTLLSSIDMLNITTRQWWTPTNLQLPRPMFRMQCAISSAHLCVASARISYDAATDTVTTEAASSKVTNLVSTWTRQGWQQKLPLMPTKRLRPGVTTYHTFVVVAGGRAEDEQTLLSSIDMLNITTRQWWTPTNLQLPRPMFRMQCAISSAHLCVASARISYDAATDTVTTVNDVWQLPVTALEKVLILGDDVKPHHWTKVAPTPYFKRYYKTQLIL